MVSIFVKATALATALCAMTVSADIKMCSMPSTTYTQAKQQYPELRNALQTVQDAGFATWYTDNMGQSDRQNLFNNIKACPGDSAVTVVVYGLPNKDCDAGYSGGGQNKNTNDYKQFVQALANAVGSRKAIYVMEPDAVGLSNDGACGVQNNYISNIQEGLKILAANGNADIYLDVGYWTLQDSASAQKVAGVVKKMASIGKLKGIALNTSNYRPNSELSKLCSNFQTAYGSNALKCIADSSRNYVQNPPNTEWCNQVWAGIGHPPTSNTGFSNLDYLMWIKPAGESDGTCNGGPQAGQFWKDGFTKLWNNGYFVKEKGQCEIGRSNCGNTPAPTNNTPQPTNNNTTSPRPTPTQTSNNGGGAAKWGQCGGIGFNGPTSCKEGKCVKLNDYYSQCQ